MNFWYLFCCTAVAAIRLALLLLPAACGNGCVHVHDARCSLSVSCKCHASIVMCGLSSLARAFVCQQMCLYGHAYLSLTVILRWICSVCTHAARRKPSAAAPTPRQPATGAAGLNTSQQSQAGRPLLSGGGSSAGGSTSASGECQQWKLYSIPAHGVDVLGLGCLGWDG